MTTTVTQPRRILAANPSPLTGPGTNTFLIGDQQVAVIDPGPDDPDHIAAIIRAGQGRISHIFVTHSHLDHSAGAARLARETGAPVHAFGPALSGRSPVMQHLAASGLLGGGEGMDMYFAPDIRLAHGSIVQTDEWCLRAIHTPGHCGNHLSFLWNDTLFCGDIVMGWSSTLISPPDGDLADYFRSLDLILGLSPARLLPAHGDPIEDPAARLDELARHRRDRTAQILSTLRSGPATAAELAARIYDVPPHLQPAARRNVLAHLVALTSLGAVKAQPELAETAHFHLP